MESIQNIRYPEPREYTLKNTSNIYTANIYIKHRPTQGPPLWERLEKFSLLSFQRRRERYIAIHIWKIRHGLTSYELQIIFVDNNRHGTIAKVLLQRGCEMRHRSLLENSFAIMGPRIWNFIPGHIRKCDTLDLFKRHLTQPRSQDF